MGLFALSPDPEDARLPAASPAVFEASSCAGGGALSVPLTGTFAVRGISHICSCFKKMDIC